jgi:hypothetical protein
MTLVFAINVDWPWTDGKPTMILSTTETLNNLLLKIV